MNWRFSRSLIYPLTAILVVMAVVPVAIVGWGSVSSNREQISTLEMQYLTRQAVGLASEITLHFIRSSGRIEATAQALRPADGAALVSGDVIEVLKGITEADEGGDILWLRALDLRGEGQQVQRPGLSRQAEAALAALLAEAFSQNVQGKSVRRDFVRVTGEEPMALVSVPLRTPAGSVVGAIQGVVSLRVIAKRISVETGRGVTVDVVDRSGDVLFSNGPYRVGTGAAAHPLVAAFLDKKDIRLTRTYEDPLRPTHEEVLGSLCPVEMRAGEAPPWAVVTARDVGVAFAGVNAMVKRTALLGVFAGFAAVLAGVLLARRITLPLRHLAGVTAAVAGGDFSRRVPVTTQNELGQLAANFNVMSEEIERYIKSLRQALRENQELLLDSIRALAAAIDAKNPYTRGHSEHVAKYAVAIARAYGISGPELMRIEIAALLHDVGKIGIEDAILLKPQRLTDSEFAVMRTHPTKGASIVATIKRLRDMLPGIRSHHESWDGTGYPDGLAGEKIPLLARIIAAADTFDAMTTERPYQTAMTFNAALDRMRQLAGARLDPNVVRAFFKGIQTGDLVLLGQVEVA